jgi:hypothetical protein
MTVRELDDIPEPTAADLAALEEDLDADLYLEDDDFAELDFDDDLDED